MTTAAPGLRSPAIHAEWTKLRTVRAPAWLLLGLVATTVGLGAVAANALACSTAGCAGDPVRSALAGVQLGQALAAVLGVLAIGDEYGTGTIGTTALTVPRRVRIVAAKAIVLTGPVLVAATVAVAGSLVTGHNLIARHLVPGHGDATLDDLPPGTPATHGVDLLAPATLRAAAGTALYLALIALLALGLATAVRDTATAVGLTLGLLYLFPILAGVVGNPAWHRHLQQIGPSTAGLAVQTTVDVPSLPIGPWPGLGVLALWSVGALILGGTLLHARDV
jgi:ABC-2 type transport system permease protein